MLFLEFLCFWTVFGNNNMGFSLNQRPTNSYCDANSTISNISIPSSSFFGPKDVTKNWVAVAASHHRKGDGNRMLSN